MLSYPEFGQFRLMGLEFIFDGIHSLYKTCESFSDLGKRNDNENPGCWDSFGRMVERYFREQLGSLSSLLDFEVP